MASDIDKLLNALPKSPNFMVMHFSDDSTLVDKLQEYCIDSLEYRILTFSSEAQNRLEHLDNSYTKVQLINPKRPKYNHPSKFYDYLFVTSLPENREEFLKKVYYALKNGAPIFIFLDKNSRDFAYTLEAELIEKNFVASSLIDIDNFLVVSAKKMHGWSGA